MNNTCGSQEIVWINHYLGQQGITNPTTEDLESIRNFVFFWNVFEDKICRRNVSIDQIERHINRVHADGKLRKEDFQEHLNYFRDRYIENGGTNQRFENLTFRPRDRRELVTSVLIGSEKTLTSVVVALLIIVFRLRNNLFHGIKSLYRLQDQIDNFKHANMILMKIIELA